MSNTVSQNPHDPDITASDRYYERALRLIPGATQTLAKGPTQYVRGVAPKFLRRAHGSHVWDVDGNEFLDYQMAIGPVVLGYCFPAVDQAIRNQLADGITFSMMHPLEVEVATLVHEMVPGAEMVRFSKTGCDVTSAAIRLARAYTGRSGVLCCGYHGWHDWYIGVTDRNAGIPEEVRSLTSTFEYNDIASVVEAIDEHTACVILEPVTFQPPRDGFLERLREICTQRGVVLIFDEMWTGFRLATGGAQECFGVWADLMCFSKAIANGMPLSVLCGRADIMRLCDQEVFFYTTFGGEALSLAAAYATMQEIRLRHVPDALAGTGARLMDAYNDIADSLGMSYTRCAGMPCRTMVAFDAGIVNPLEAKSLLQQEMFRNGILWGGFHTLSFSHTADDIAYTIEVYNRILPVLRDAVAHGTVKDLLRGEPVAPVFRKTTGFHTKPKRHIEHQMAGTPR